MINLQKLGIFPKDQQSMFQFKQQRVKTYLEIIKLLVFITNGSKWYSFRTSTEEVNDHLFLPHELYWQDTLLWAQS